MLRSIHFHPNMNLTKVLAFSHIAMDVSSAQSVNILETIKCTSEVKPWSQGWLIAAGAYPGFCSMKQLEVFLLPLDRMLIHRRSLPRIFVRFPQQIAGTHLYTWVERGTMRVKCLAQEHNTLSLARARTRTARSGVERTNHEATAPPKRTSTEFIS